MLFRKPKSTLCIVTLFLALLSLILIISVPSFLSTTVGKRIVISSINQGIPGQIEIKSVSFSWFGPQKFEGIQLKTPSGEFVASLETASFEHPIWTLLRKKPYLNASLNNLRADLKPMDSGESNLANCLGKRFSIPLDTPLSLRDFHTAFYISESRIAFSAIGLISCKAPLSEAKPDRSIAMVDEEDRSGKATASGTLHEIKPIAASSSSEKNNQGGVSEKFAFSFELGQELSFIQAEVQEFPVILLDVFAAALYPELSGMFQALLGETLDVNIKGEKDSSYSLNITSPRLQWEMKGNMEKEGWFVQNPGKATLSLSSEVLNKGLGLLGASFSQEKIHLLEPSILELQWEKFTIPLSFFDSKSKDSSFKKASMDMVMTLPKITLRNASLEQIALEGFNVALKAPSTSQEMELHSEGLLRIDDTPFPFSFALKAQKPSHIEKIGEVLAQPTQLHFSLNDVFTANLDRFFKTSGIFSRLFGSNLTFHMHSSAEDPQLITLQLRSTNLRIPSLTLKINENFYLGEFWLPKELSGEMATEKIVLKEHFPKNPSSRANTVIRAVKIPWKIRPASKEIELSWSGHFEETETKEPSGNFKGSAYAGIGGSHLPFFQASFQGNRIPASVAEWTTNKNIWKALFGPSLNINLHADLKGSVRALNEAVKWEQGPINLDISGNLGRLRLNGKMVQGSLSLLSPLEWVMTPSEALGQEVLAQWIPPFKGLISGANPIHLTIQPKGFSFPLYPFSLEKVQFENAALDLGLLYFHNTDEFKKLLQLLKTEKVEKISFWSTPLYFKMKNGIGELSRTDTLVLNRYPLAGWGKVDCLQDRLNMVLGISEEALLTAYGLNWRSSGEMFQVPVSGSLSHIKVDSSQLTKKIGSLLAKNSGSREGILLGAVLDLAGGKKSKTPPPTTYPFPWNHQASKDYPRGQAAEEEDLRSLSTPKEETPKDKSVKEKKVRVIKKEASQILKRFLR